MSDQSRGGIYIVNPATGVAEAITSDELAAAQDAHASKPAPKKRQPPESEELTDAPEN